MEPQNRTSNLTVTELESLYVLAQKLLGLTDYDEMLDTIVQDSLRILGGERGFLVLKQGDGLDFKVARNWSREELEGAGDAVSGSIVADVLERRQPVLIEDAMADERFAKTESVLRMGIRSVLAAPLSVKLPGTGREREQVGVLYLETSAISNLFGSEQLELFDRVLGLCSHALESGTRRILLEQRNSLLEKDFLARHDFPGIVGRSSQFLRVLKTVAQVAGSELPVLVQGPSGTGKELIVRALMLNSRRSQQPFVTVNCGAISPSLLESELFGHRKGAFTGATRDKRGLITSADGGTVFLDEVGELPKELQVKLLRTLQFGEVQPVGSTRPLKVDVRFLAATNRDLEEEVAEGRFREDLLYRLNAITIEVPALSQRSDDILPLFRHFVDEATSERGMPPQITPELEKTIQAYGWPGNVRELENEVRRLGAMVPEGEPWAVDDLSPRITSSPATSTAGQTLADQEQRLIVEHLKLSEGNRTHAAKSLGISREGLRKKMKRYGID